MREFVASKSDLQETIKEVFQDKKNNISDKILYKARKGSRKEISTNKIKRLLFYFLIDHTDDTFKITKIIYSINYVCLLYMSLEMTS